MVTHCYLILNMKKEIREPELARLEEAGMQAVTCALRAALEVDERFEVERQENGSRLSSLDVVHVTEIRPHFQSSSWARASAYLGCNSCGQTVQMQEVSEDLDPDNGIFRLKAQYPLQCPAYTDGAPIDIRQS